MALVLGVDQKGHGRPICNKELIHKILAAFTSSNKTIMGKILAALTSSNKTIMTAHEETVKEVTWVL